MTYYCGIGPCLGEARRDPHIECNGCGAVKLVAKHGLPPAWFMAGKAPPGWKVIRRGDTRVDYCPTCKTIQSAVSR